MTTSSNNPRRGDVWFANTGGKKHAIVIVSLDQRNMSDRVRSILAIPFGSYGAEGPTSKKMEPGETGLPEPSFLKAHFIQVIEKKALINKLPRSFNAKQMKEVVAMINRAIDPDAQL